MPYLSLIELQSLIQLIDQRRREAILTVKRLDHTLDALEALRDKKAPFAMVTEPTAIGPLVHGKVDDKDAAEAIIHHMLKGDSGDVTVPQAVRVLVKATLYDGLQERNSNYQRAYTMLNRSRYFFLASKGVYGLSREGHELAQRLTETEQRSQVG